MDGDGDSVGRCFPARKESRQGEPWIVEAMALPKESSRSESRQAGVSAGAVSALALPGEALLLSVQGEAGQRTVAVSESGIIRGMTATAEEAGRLVGACAVVAGAGPR